MTKYFVILMLAVSSASFVVGQETSAKLADVNETAKAEVLQQEQELVQALLKGGSFAADFLDRTEADDGVWIIDGVVSTKAKLIAAWRSGGRKQLSVDHHEFRVSIYGNTAVVTYLGHNRTEVDGKIHEGSYRTTDTRVKRGGVWLRVAHIVQTVPMQ